MFFLVFSLAHSVFLWDVAPLTPRRAVSVFLGEASAALAAARQSAEAEPRAQGAVQRLSFRTNH